MTACSAVPAVIDALVTILRGNVTATVIDGPLQGDPPAGDFVCVGWSPFDDTAGEGTGHYADTSGDRNEDFAVAVYVSTYGGDGTYKTLRDRAKVVGDLVAAQVKATPTLSVLTGWAGVQGSRWHQQPSDSGPVVGLVLNIQGTARI